MTLIVQSGCLTWWCLTYELSSIVIFCLVLESLLPDKQGISYYTLSSQYTEQQHDFAKLLEKNQLLEKEVDVTKQQLHLKEDEFVKSKTELESVNQELTSSKKSIEEKIKENSILQSKVKDLQVNLEWVSQSIRKWWERRRHRMEIDYFHVILVILYD